MVLNAAKKQHSEVFAVLGDLMSICAVSTTSPLPCASDQFNAKHHVKLACNRCKFDNYNELSTGCQARECLNLHHITANAPADKDGH